MEEMATVGHTLATDVVEYLVEKGLPFRQAHHTVGKIVRQCLEEGKELSDITLKEFKKFAKVISEDIFTVLDLRHSVDSRSSIGGTSLQQVQEAIAYAEKELNA